MTTPDPSGTDEIDHGDSYAFDRVSFCYTEGNDVIHDVSFETPAGALTALTGPSGSGKSTLLRLMARFWDYQRGQVRFAGKELRSIVPESLLSQVSMVMQNAYLFRGTIRENLCFGNENITEQKIIDLENGRITQHGTHDQLVGTDGLYSRLWELQNQAGNYTFKPSPGGET